jgi:DNA-directed RNA polymerase sigma subunit (sigma70/sigma32)
MNVLSKIRQKEKRRIEQRFLLNKANDLIKQGKTFNEIRQAFPKLNYASLRRIKRIMGIPIKVGYPTFELLSPQKRKAKIARAEIITELRTLGYTYSKIGEMFNLSHEAIRQQSKFSKGLNS